MLKLILAISLTLFAGCQTSYLGDENSPFYIVPTGSRVVLKQPITISTGQVAVYVQNGKIMKNVELQHYYPFCRFEVRNIQITDRTIAPDEILITKSAHEETTGAIAQAGPLMVAGPIRISNDFGGSPPIQSFSTRMELRSVKQPDVSRLTCSQWGYHGLDRHVTIAEMRKTLDPLFALDIKEK